MTEPFEMPKLRAAWAKLRPESLNESARRLAVDHPDVTAKVLKNERFRSPATFPQPLPIAGRYHQSRLSVYSGAEVDYWVAKVRGRGLAEMPSTYATLRAKTMAVVERVQPVQLSHIATVMLPDVEPGAALRRVRSWRENRHVNGFPEPLPVAADYVTAISFFSLVEVEGWAENAKRRATSPEALEARAAALSARAQRGAATRAAQRAAQG